MDVFKTTVGSYKEYEISRERYFMVTKGLRPYVVADSDGHVSYYAVCPLCDNPIQIIGLNQEQQDAHPRRPYGRHVAHDVPGVAGYDEAAYLACRYANRNYRRGPSRRPRGDRTGGALYRLMRDRFDRIEYLWRTASGIRLGAMALRRALTLWRDNESWRNYDASYRNLAQMLFMGMPEQGLYGQSVIADCPVARILDRTEAVTLTPQGRYLRVGTTRYADITFTVGPPVTERHGEHLGEWFPLIIALDGRPVGGPVPVRTDPGRVGHVLSMDGWHDDRRLLGIARDVLGCS